ncbi:MAG: tRNA preQ1(34) S-adenosylmethionine ribosyltransferase-isomerase QueA [Planctomycetia bacterium]|nr:tRNA preQ1(34) S-adenosylmethionine ribosyltransferase-isomerase QueA [Planctomycetia bacterium]
MDEKEISRQTESSDVFSPYDFLDHYDYTLPEGLIASRPQEDRLQGRLMVVDRQRGKIDHAKIGDLPQLLSCHDIMVFNDTKVVPARLVGVRTLTGGAWNGLFLEQVETESRREDWVARTGDESLRKYPLPLWNILGTTRGKLQPGECVTLLDTYSRPYIRLRMQKKIKSDGSWLCSPLWDGDPVEESCWEILSQIGRVPIPPYIRKGQADAQDAETYQTVYAEKPGAVAAPTAGLHFTPQLLKNIDRRGTKRVTVTLHVGMGTFRPINVQRLDQHQMHREWGCLEAQTAKKLAECRENGGRVVAVGTTSVRVLESAKPAQAFSGYTELFIRPPYKFHAVDVMMTNFHLPKSSLLVLVRTFGGDELIKRAYQEAIREKYRFFSYGDAMIIL